MIVATKHLFRITLDIGMKGPMLNHKSRTYYLITSKRERYHCTALKLMARVILCEDHNANLDRMELP